ncbi:HD domain-containing protein [Caldimonas tepidiphila]|uniref:HD domain-containing protein n=1 Tax=Caldimonas tepidiphila TaxID=2315841 RepID=UPI000E5BD54E|nr:HD domain-containing protein [Caldimonas tepidiphila]
MTPRYTQAIALAARAHEGQSRKGTAIPYITHPVAVAALVAEYGGDEDQQIAALLHDVLEDGGPQYEPEIEAAFGGRVLALVRGCTDGMPDENGTKAPWVERKRAYLTHLAEIGDDVLLVSGCDKLSNARAILSDLQGIGPAVFDRFTAGREGTLWYYAELARIFGERAVPMARALTDTVGQLERLAR